MPIFRERVWGRENLAPFFPVTPRDEHVGEVWFTVEENLTSLNQTLGRLIRDHPEILGSGAEPRYPGICPLLLKLLFTNSRLSVQVHPDDDYAHKHHQTLGKTEAWYVLEANPLGKIAVGFRESLTREKLRQAAFSGEIENLLDWQKVTQGEVVYVPAGRARDRRRRDDLRNSREFGSYLPALRFWPWARNSFRSCPQCRSLGPARSSSKTRTARSLAG